MANSEEFIQTALSQKGDKYVFASEASPLDPNPTKFDCSELVQWAGARIGIVIPDGSWNQYAFCKHIPTDEGYRTRGALLFAGTRTRVHHVAISLGDGTTIEARGSKWGVGTWPSTGRFDGAGKIPNLTYVIPRQTPPVNRGGGVGIQPGSSSQAVTFLQNMLNIIRGHKKRSLIRTDGLYGNQTKAAVKEFQVEWESIAGFHRLINLDLKNNIEEADPDTCRAIGIAVKLIIG